jgi:hypothetical protein
MRKTWIVAGIAVLLAACTDRKVTESVTAIAGPTPPVLPPGLPTTVPGVLALAMPIDPGDSANAVFGLAPYGYHEATHATDGHPGWEIEYRPGGIARAAAAGTVQSITPDPGGHFIVQLEHVVGTHIYRTTYTNLVSLAADVRTSEVVRVGQALGTPAGTTHFQLDDFEYYRDMSNPNAVSPEPFLTAAAKSLFDSLWSRAIFGPELVEPFATNPRVLAFPASRTWTRAGGDGPAGIRFTRRSTNTTDYEYSLLAESGTTVESGTVVLNLAARPLPAIDLLSPTARRLGVYDIVSNELRLSLAQPGSLRPADLGAASIYRTNQ